MRAAICIPILESYGQNEIIIASFSTYATDGSVGHIGGCRNNMEFKLIDNPEIGYTSKEVNKTKNIFKEVICRICVRGKDIF